MQFETLLLNRIVFGSTSSICEAIIATCLVYMVAKTNNVTGRRKFVAPFKAIYTSPLADIIIPTPTPLL